MKENQLKQNPNPLVQYIQKPANEFTKADIIKYIEDNKIEMVNFRYVGGDGRLKTLNFIIQSKEHLENLLSSGERVDGSSIFSYIGTCSSDLYVIPRFKTAFINPFNEIPTLDLLCSYYDKDGLPFASSPENILKKAHTSLKKLTGFNYEVMGELEYYVIDEAENIFPANDQKGYHESGPFAKFESFRTEAMKMIAQTGGLIKYGHTEVGNFCLDKKYYEQNEIEFLPTTLEDAADQLIIAKWIIRMLAYQYGLTISFAPKITVGKAGSGLHIHTRLVKDGKNMMIENGKLNDNAKKAIAGYLSLAPSLTAFGNTIPTSYFRLVPHQEAPTNICWGDRNRSVLVRVPLGWINDTNMINNANPLEPKVDSDFSIKQTVEFRCPDGSADIYLLLAGLTVAARHGFEIENAIDFANKTYVDVNIFDEEHKERVKSLNQLPISCWNSAECLDQQKDIYTKYDVFPIDIINGIIAKLKKYEDKDLMKQLKGNDADLIKIVDKYFHCG